MVEHHVGIWSTILGLSGMLALAVLMLPAAKRLNFPYTVLLAVVGVGLGLLGNAAADAHVPVFGDFLHALGEMEITADIVLFLFLPVLVFEAALAMDVRRLLEDIRPILFLAVVGLLISTAVVGASLYAVSGMALVACLMLGAICSATDPVAVVAIFKEVGAPKRLAILVEGESLFNDATAIVVFTILAGMMTGSADSSVLSGLASFLRVFVGGIIVGWALARLFVWIISRLENLPLVEQSLTISLAYLSFIFAEHYLHVSGVMAVVVAALVMGSRGRTVIQPHDWHSLHETWEQLGFWANSIIFLLVGLAVPEIMAGFGVTQALWLGVLIVTALAARATIIYLLLPLLSALNMAQTVSVPFRTVMFWGGLRGAVSLALALIVLEAPGYSEEVKQFVGVLVTGFVLFTLFVNAPTIRFVISFFKLDELSMADTVLRDRAIALSLDRISGAIEDVAARQDASEATTGAIAGGYRARSADAHSRLERMTDLPKAEWVRIGLANLAVRERASYERQFEAGFLSSSVYRIVGEHLEDIVDCLRTGGVDEHERAVERSLDFGREFHFSMYLQRRWNAMGPLSSRVAERFEVLSAMKLALREVLEDAVPRVGEMVGAAAAGEAKGHLEARLGAVAEALRGLELQYPDYAQYVERRLLERGALRLEAQSYKRMYADALITGEVYGDLEARVREKEIALARMPRLDLGLDPVRLVGEVPLFTGLPEDRIREIAQLLKPRLVLPGEMVVRAGDAGDAMYFVSNGALRVDVEPLPVQLGSGDFFGELALITQQPRNADVVAVGFADLLVLRTADFQRLMEGNPDARVRIEAVARERLAQTQEAAALDPGTDT
ncbi:MAG: cation:proton antiporter [Pseudomonadota bacterium]|nr:cation:proton antiporter [Pseudomonadota bacterium]